jgi:hypothetical protein
VLFWSLLLVGAGGCLLPVIPDLAWIVACRFVIGLGAGAAIVAGSLSARQGRYAALGLGLFGGAMQVGAGLGLLVTPTLFGLSLSLAAMLGAVGLLAGMLFRPLGGLLLSRRVFSPGTLMRAGTAMVCLGVLLLALPPHAVLVTGWGLALFACGTTLPYTATFDEAGQVGTVNGLGPGMAQGVVSVIAAPASAFGPPLIGALLGQQGSFALRGRLPRGPRL